MNVLLSLFAEAAEAGLLHGRLRALNHQLIILTLGPINPESPLSCIALANEFVALCEDGVLLCNVPVVPGRPAEVKGAGVDGLSRHCLQPHQPSTSHVVRVVLGFRFSCSPNRSRYWSGVTLRQNTPFPTVAGYSTT